MLRLSKQLRKTLAQGAPAFPAVEAAAKAKFARSIETQPGGHFAALSAFGIVNVPIMATRNKDVRRQRVVFRFHGRKLGLDITYRRSKSFQCVLIRAPRTWNPKNNAFSLIEAETVKPLLETLPCAARDCYILVTNETDY
jgi:hypothetical protein